MNKLQLYICKSSQPTTPLVEMNATAQGRSAVADMSPHLLNLHYTPSQKPIILAVRRTPTAWALHVLRTIPPTAPAHLNAMLFIPLTLDVLTAEIVEAVKLISSIVQESAITEEHLQRLRNYFAKECDVADRTPPPLLTGQQGAAYITFGSQGAPTMEQALAEVLFNPATAARQAVMLIGPGVAPKPGAIAPFHTPAGQKENAPDDTAARYTYRFSIPLTTADDDDDDLLEFDIASDTPLEQSPIQGHRIRGSLSHAPDHINELIPTAPGRIKTIAVKAFWCLVGAVAGILLMGVVNFIYK